MNSLYKALYAQGPSTDRPMATGRLLFAGMADALAEAAMEQYAEQQRIATAPDEPDIAPPTGMDDNPFAVGDIPDEAFAPLLKELKPNHDSIGRLGLPMDVAMDPEALKHLEYADG